MVEQECHCAEIMNRDPTRHFRGCPLREKYPTHEAEQCGGTYRYQAWSPWVRRLQCDKCGIWALAGPTKEGDLHNDRPGVRERSPETGSGIFVRIKRGESIVDLEVEDLTDEEANEFFGRMTKEGQTRWCTRLVQILRERKSDGDQKQPR